MRSDESVWPRDLTPIRKEVNAMKYVKPEIAPIASAITAVQSSTIKQKHVVPDSMRELATTSAYEADE
jgi:hypothetical protein